MKLQFSGAAHVIRSKKTIENHLNRERSIAKERFQEPVKEWRQEFPYDNRCDEAVVLTGKDLQDAGDQVNGWDFGKALNYVRSILRSDFDSVDPKIAEGDLLLGRTASQQRAALYKHDPRYIQ